MSEKKRCSYCGEWYAPYARAAERQKHCGRPVCRRRHKRAVDRAWRLADPQWRADRQAKALTWARERGYWRNWRAENPEYRAREALRMRRKRVEAVAKQEGLLRNPVEHLKRIRYERVLGVAKQEGLEHRLDEVLDYLIVRERVAKQEGGDVRGAGTV